MKQRTAMRCWIGYGILAVLLCSLILLNLNIGTVSLSPSEAVSYTHLTLPTTPYV